MQTFSGKQIGLRALEPYDLETLYKWENNPEIWQLGQTLKPFSRDILVRYLETAQLDIFESRQVRFVIHKIGKPNEVVGLIDLFDFDPFNQRAGVGILIGEVSDRKQGYAIEALSLLCQYSFEILMLHQLYCSIHAINEPSIKLFTKGGFTKTGQRTDWIKTRTGWQTEFFYQLSIQEWESKAE
ncbi:MAG: GNAT family N-acetyltransferase [Bacteroidales bacterium]|nr:GNAT family N-acetyltransferase [Bacteroidales bacterium]